MGSWQLNGKARWVNQGDLWTSISGSRRFFSGRLGTIIVTAVITGLLVFVACFMVWHHLGGGAWLSEVRVKEALLLPRDRLTLLVGSCWGGSKGVVVGNGYRCAG